MSELKKAKTYKEQLEIMKSRGSIINNEVEVEMHLSYVNYYALSGYLYQYKDENENFKDGITFEKIWKQYLFDEELRSILLKIISAVEKLFRNRVSYHIAINNLDNPCVYEEIKFFTNQSKHSKFMKILNGNIEQQEKYTFVSHHIEKYDKKFPIWVAVEIMTLGNLETLYKNIPSNLRKEISISLDTSPEILSSWINNIYRTRNLLSHNHRIYNNKLGHTPKLKKNINFKPESKYIFDQIFMMKHLVGELPLWHKMMVDIKNLLQEYEDVIELRKIDFPEDWFAYLSV